MSEYDGKFTTQNQSDLVNKLDIHNVSFEIEYVYLYPEKENAHRGEQIDVDLNEDDVLVQLVNERLGSGEYVAVNSTIVDELIEKSLIESV